ncbi:MAG: matrixin family metalloprotease [Candidatus Nanohaloarchaea archaeon]
MEVSRRKLLSLTGAGAAAATGYVGADGARKMAWLATQQFLGYDGIPDRYIDDEDFWNQVENDFRSYREKDFREGEPNALVDIRYLENGEPSRWYMDTLERWFEEHGVNALCLAGEGPVDDELVESFSGDVTRLLGDPGPLNHFRGPGGVYGKIKPEYRKAAMQVFLAPYDLALEHGKSESMEGFSYGTRSAIEADAANIDELTEHEIGHMIGLVHSRDEDNLMQITVSEDSSLDEMQWSYIRARLS